VERKAERLKEAGLRVTAPRLTILAALEADRTHPTAEEIHAKLRTRHPSLSLSTVYKTLEAFLAAGLCRRVNAEGSLRVDGVPRPHDHAVCRGCGRVYDVDRAVCPVPQPPARLPGDLVVAEVRVEYDVVCPRCRAAARRSGREAAMQRRAAR